MVRHIVMWDLNETVKDKKATAKELKQKLEELNRLIQEIVELKVVIDPLDTNCNAQILLDSVFHSRQDLEKYIEHPEHKRVGQFVRSVVINRRSMDYEF